MEMLLPPQPGGLSRSGLVVRWEEGRACREPHLLRISPPLLHDSAQGPQHLPLWPADEGPRMIPLLFWSKRKFPLNKPSERFF